MLASPMNVFAAGLSLLCLAHPIRGDPRSNPEIRTWYAAQPVAVHETNSFRDARALSSYPQAVADERARYADRVDGSKPDRIRLERVEDEGGSNEDEIADKMRLLDGLLSEDSTAKAVDANGIEDGIIPEESRRIARQVRKRKPGFFWTLARVTFETINDTRSAIKQISEIINNSVAPDSATESTMPRGSLTATGSPNGPRNETAANVTETTTASPMSSTTASFVLTRSSLQSLIRRNVKGLVRLFNIEWRDALNQSEATVKEFQKDLGNQVGVYLRDNPRAILT